METTGLTDEELADLIFNFRKANLYTTAEGALAEGVIRFLRADFRGNWSSRPRYPPEILSNIRRPEMDTPAYSGLAEKLGKITKHPNVGMPGRKSDIDWKYKPEGIE